jgi:hypothetical protein
MQYLFLSLRRKKSALVASQRLLLSSVFAVVLITASPVIAPGGPSNDKWLNVTGTVPLPGDALRDQIVVFFDAQIQLPKLPDGRTTDPFTLRPTIAGQFRIGPNFVSFKPNATIPPSEIVEAEMNGDIQSADGRRLNPQQRKITFATFIFEPREIWEIREQPDRTVLGIRFPTRIAVQDVRTHLSMRSGDGRDIPFLLEPGGDDKTCRIILEGNSRRPVTITVAKGLADAGGRFRLEKDCVYPYPAGAAPVYVNETRWGRFDAQEQEIVIGFSHPVKAADLKEYLLLKDLQNATTVAFSITTIGEQSLHRIALHLTNALDVKISVAVAPGLAGVKSGLEKAYSTKLERRAEALRIVNQWWTSQGKEGLMLCLMFNKEMNSAADLQKHLELSPSLTDMRVTPSGYNRFSIYGNWKSNQPYQIRITPGLTYAGGAVVDQPIIAHTKTEAVPPYLAFTQAGKYYFPRSNDVSLAIESRNVDKVEVTLYRMFPSNIAVALSDMREGEGGTQFNDSWCEQIETMHLDLASLRDQLVRTPLVTDKLFPKDRKGVFCLSVSGINGARDTKIVLLTNIGLLSHWQDDALILFAHDLYSLAPLPDARVSVYSTKNQLLGREDSDERGIAHLKEFNTARGTPRVVVVEHGNDYTFLELKPRREESQQFNEAMPAYDREGYDAFIYADRQLYRPGEKVHLRWIVRKNYGDPVANVPLLITIVKPNGKSLISQPTTLSALGTGELDLATQNSYPTGRYEARLSVPGSDEAIGTYDFNLEEFVPNRIKASLTIPESRWLAGREYEIRLSAQHLFGAPAEGRKCEAVVSFQREGFKTKNWKTYRFDNDSAFVPHPVPCGEQNTDSSGVAAFRFSYRAPAAVTFPLKATIVGRVFELGGRAVAAKAEAMLFPSDICLGISAASSADKKGIEVFAAAINADETPANLDKVEIVLEKQIWNYYVRRYYSHHESDWAESFQPVETREVALNDGKGSTVFSLQEYSYYRVRVFSPKTPQFSTLSFYSYGGKCEILDAARPSLIKVILDKELYNIGDEAEVRIESPFDGKGIIVLQGEEIQRMVPIEIKNNVGRAHFKIGRKQFPNVWVEAPVIHTVERGRTQVYPFSSFAVANLKVRDPEKEIKVSFPSLPKEIRPSTEVQFAIAARSTDGEPVEAELTLAAVDEGIHSITDYPTPDPYQWLCRSRLADCRQAHYYDKVAYDFEKPAIGGDGALAEVGKRLGAVGENWIKPVALWSGVVRTDKNGRATVTMKVPEFNGQLRLVAVACSEKSLGSCSSRLLVRRPYILQTNMPRFLLPGDSVRCRGSLFNHTDSPCRARVSWSFGGVFREGAGSREMDIAAHGESSFFADLSAGKAIGQGEIRWDALLFDSDGRELEHLKETALLPVRPPAAYQSYAELKVLKPGETQTFRNVKFLDDDQAEIELTAGPNPMLRLQEALRYVIGYPYGCVEQTTSRLMPLYLLRKAGSITKLALTEDTRLDEYLQSGIARLFSMQTSSGGLGFWPGANNPYPYGSIYALHFLTLVKNGREFDLPAESMDALRRYVRSIALDWSNDSPSALYQRAYAVYVLALGGNLEAIQQIERFDDLALPTTARFLLAAALAQNTKDLDRVKLYLSTKPAQPYVVRERDATLISDIRNTAIELLTLRQIGGNPEQALEKANRLIAFLDHNHYGTTQETAFVLSALVGYISDLAEHADLASAKIAAGAKESEIRGGEIYHNSLKGKGVEFIVANTGKVDLFVNITTRGIPETVDAAPVSKGIAIRRRFYSQQKAEISSTTFQQTGSYVVMLEINCEDYVKNLIIADLLPAGLEIENPRLNPDALPGKAFAGAVTPSHLEVRDDRLVLAFDALRSGRHLFYYVVNAVTPGRYQYPPVQAECMYDGSIRGQSAASSIEVR